ncbi:Murinoglobulin-2-like 4, partial [Homarus americanus]
LTSGDLPISVEHLVEPLPPPIEGTVRGVVSINVNLPPTASPKAKVLVWYTREDGEVVADTRELEVEKCLGSSASLTWSESQAQPGQQTTLTLSSDPNSVCSLGVVDRSSELLATDPDPITLEKLFNFADDFDINPWRNSQVNTHKYCHDKYLQKLTPGVSSDQGGIGFPGPSWHQSYYSDYVDALSMFDNSGLYIFTDLTVETRPCEKEERHHYFETAGLPGFAFGGASGSAGNGGGGLGGPPPSPQASFAPTTTNPSASRPPNVESSVFSNKEDSEEVADSPRTNFPETWLWDIVVLPSSGVNSQDLTLPDTITQWVGKAVCVHPEKGVALSERESITTFTPFFVDLTLPPTVKRGEILPVKMSIFNYLDRPIP